MFKFFLFKFIYIFFYILLKSNEKNINSTSFIDKIYTKIKEKQNISKDIIEKSFYNFLNITHIKIKSNFEKKQIYKNFNSSAIKINNINNLKKNLLIGAVRNYKWEIIEPFFKSFKQARFENCECVIFVEEMTKFTINKIKSYGAIVHEIPDKYRNVTIINCRWKIYDDFLNDHGDKYKLVFTADLRDSFFQRDVFKLYENKRSFLGVAIEDGILSQIVNKDWVINAYGEDLHKTIEHERIICVGTIWGTVDKFSEFSRIMWEKLNSKWSIMNNVVEQAVGNYLIYHDKLFNDCLIKSFNNNGSVMTLALTNNDNIKFDSDNNILNGKGEIASVIHQYDRKPDIIRKVKYKFNIDNSKEVKYKVFNIIFLRLKLSLFIIIIFFVIFICLLIISLFRNKKKRKLRLSKKIQLKMVDYKLLKI